MNFDHLSVRGEQSGSHQSPKIHFRSVCSRYNTLDKALEKVPEAAIHAANLTKFSSLHHICLDCWRLTTLCKTDSREIPELEYYSALFSFFFHQFSQGHS